MKTKNRISACCRLFNVELHPEILSSHRQVSLVPTIFCARSQCVCAQKSVSSQLVYYFTGITILMDSKANGDYSAKK